MPLIHRAWNAQQWRDDERCGSIVEELQAAVEEVVLLDQKQSSPTSVVPADSSDIVHMRGGSITKTSNGHYQVTYRPFPNSDWQLVDDGDTQMWFHRRTNQTSWQKPSELNQDLPLEQPLGHTDNLESAYTLLKAAELQSLWQAAQQSLPEASSEPLVGGILTTSRRASLDVRPLIDTIADCSGDDDGLLVEEAHEIVHVLLAYGRAFMAGLGTLHPQDTDDSVSLSQLCKGWKRANRQTAQALVEACLSHHATAAAAAAKAEASTTPLLAAPHDNKVEDSLGQTSTLQRKKRLPMTTTTTSPRRTKRGKQ